MNLTQRTHQVCLSIYKIIHLLRENESERCHSGSPTFTPGEQDALMAAIEIMSYDLYAVAEEVIDADT